MRFNSFIGTNPLNNRYYLIFLLTYSLIGFVMSCIIRLQIFHQVSLSPIGITISVIIMFCIGIFSLVCWKDAWIYGSLWADFFSDISRFDNKMEKIQESTLNLYLKIIIGHIFYLFIQIMSYMSTMEHIIYILSLTYLYFVSLQIFTTTLLIDIIFGMFVRRYELLRKKTTEVFLSPSRNQIFWNTIKLKELHLLLIKNNIRFNDFFGQRILLLLMITFLNLLGAFQYEVLENLPSQLLDITKVLSVVIQQISFWVSNQIISLAS